MKQFSVHYSFYINTIIFLLSPYQLIYLKLLFCIIIHELGHILIIMAFKLKIKRLTLYPFGFLLDLDYYKNTILIDLLLYSSGILFNLFFYLIMKEFRSLNLLLIITNLIPLYPLDGYSILSITISIFLPYKKALYLSSIIGLIPLMIVIIFLLHNFDYLFLLNALYLIYLWINTYKSIPDKYQYFLLNRYNYNESYKKKKISIEDDVYSSFYKYRSIYFIFNNKIIDENELLALKFNPIRNKIK